MTESEQPPEQPGPISEPPPYDASASGGTPQFGAPPQFGGTASGGTPPYGPMPPQYGAVPPQYGAPPGYPPSYPGYGYGYPQQTGGNNGMAIAAMVCGICGFACLIPGLVGIVLGFVSLPQIKRKGQSGRGMAITGIVTGGLWILLTILLIVFAHHSNAQPIDGGSGSGASV